MFIVSFACNPFSKPINPLLLLGCSVWGRRYFFPTCQFLFLTYCNYFLHLSQVTRFWSLVTRFLSPAPNILSPAPKILSRVTGSLSQVTRFLSHAPKSLSPVHNFLSQVTEHWEHVTDTGSNYNLVIPTTKLLLMNIYSFKSINNRNNG